MLETLEVKRDRKESSVYINICPLAHGDLILPVDQLISNLLAWIGNLDFSG